MRRDDNTHIGVHQDGLVHVSQLADRYVADPNAVVSVGQKVKVKVISVDLERNRIALTMKKGVPDQPRRAQQPGESGNGPRGQKPVAKPPASPARIPKPGEIAANGMRFK